MSFGKRSGSRVPASAEDCSAQPATAKARAGRALAPAPGQAAPPGVRDARRAGGATARGALGVVLVCAALTLSRASAAFTFADGTSMRCIAAGQPVPEYEAPPGHKLVADNHIGIVEPIGAGYRIAWNQAMLSRLPPDMHDFIFFHECAHASVPTQDELTANCAGLRAMRAVGRAGAAVEARLAAFYGRGSEYWRKTVTCADAADLPPALQ